MIRCLIVRFIRASEELNQNQLFVVMFPSSSADSTLKIEAD